MTNGGQDMKAQQLKWCENLYGRLHGLTQSIKANITSAKVLLYVSMA